nr:hypothetical protein [Tanacetum cinerariifolium]
RPLSRVVTGTTVIITTVMDQTGEVVVFSSPGVPLRATPIWFALHVDADTQESVIELLVLASSVVKLAICRKIARRTPLRVHLVRLIRSQSKGPSEGYSYPVCTTCGCIHPGECRRAAGTCFKCGQTGHQQKDCKKNTAASTSGQADKKPCVSGRVFAITEDHAAKTS